MTQARRQARPVRLDQPGRIPDDPPSLTLEQEAPPPRVKPQLAIGPQPDSRSPMDVVHSEGYLLRCLKVHYGWVAVSEKTLVKGRLGS